MYYLYIVYLPIGKNATQIIVYDIIFYRIMQKF